MNAVDVIILTAVIASTVLGLFWGLLRQLASTFGLVIAIMMAGRFYEQLAGVLYRPEGGGLIDNQNMANIVAFAVIAIGVSLGIGIVVSVVRIVLNLLFLGWLDHLLGALFGAFQMLILIEVVLLAATLFPVPNLSEAVSQSSIAQAMIQPLSFVLDWLPPEWQILRFMLGAGR